MKLIKFTITIIASLLLFASCSSTPTTENNSANTPSFSEDSYESQLDLHTIHDQQYSGLVNTLDVYITYHGPKMTEAILQKNALVFQWDSEKMNSVKLASDKELQKETQFFVSFYTPERKQDDFLKSKTLWTFFMDVEGKRYEGKVSKVKLLTSEIQAIYPHHSRFASAYQLSFPIAANSLINKKVKLTLTGTVGTIKAEFSENGSKSLR